ncbi:MAG: tyrosine-type recombinase/integrase [Candidatus Helarchaeota archaeon]|nr:tyrosine-type recombinase/integrase [Candidatus Helarchaeota archaeon]
MSILFSIYVDIRRSFKTAYKKAGISGLHLHDLQHTFGSRLAWVTDLNIVKESIGHATLTTTQRYLHSNAGCFLREVLLLDQKSKAIYYFQTG